ncbi:hypothetical protein Tco_0962886, partial [Tanacetum coccineum]
LKTHNHYNEPSSSNLVPNVSPPAEKTNSAQQELDFLFSPLFEEYFTAGNQKLITLTRNVNAEENNTNQAADAQFEPYEFFNPLRTPVQEVAESSSRNVDNSNMNTFYQLQTRKQLAIDSEMCMFALTLSTAKLTNTKEAMADHAWIEAMQEELHQFDRLEVWELGDQPFRKIVIKLKWKALYGLKQAPRAWYDELSNFLMSKGFTKGLQIHQSPRAFSDADHAGCLDTHKITSGGIQFLGEKLVSWMSKKQDCTAMSIVEAEYMALSVSCAQVMWMWTQLKDYGFNYNKIPLYCDSQSAIAISCNPVQHSRTKHINVHYHFIKEQVKRGIIELYLIRTEYKLADMFTKALSQVRFNYLVKRLSMRCLTLTKLEVLANESA